MTSSQSQQNGSSVSNSFSENCSLYVENISSDASTKLLSDHVKQSFPDDFKSCEIIKDQKKFNTYFGYITMNTHKSADEVIKQLNGSELCGKQLRIAWNIIDSKNRGSNDSNLYVKSIRKDLSFTDFDKAFREFGDLLSTKLSTNNRGESNGYGYIRYLNSDDAKKSTRRQINS
ncbi:Polyadenylate-binding protein 2 [Entamoeba marina]